MLNKAVLVDTSPLIAFYSRDDAYHAACRDQMDDVPVGKAYTCWPVIVEATYMLRKQPEQRDDLLQSVRSGSLTILHLHASELDAVRDIFRKYRDQDIDFADACLLYLADRENIDTVLTLDRRHFGVLRRTSGEVLDILPEEA